MLNQSDQPTQEKRTTLADIRKQRRQSIIVIGFLGSFVIVTAALMLVTGYEPARYQIFALGAAFGGGYHHGGQLCRSQLRNQGRRVHGKGR